jgi:hypothetical protein
MSVGQSQQCRTKFGLAAGLVLGTALAGCSSGIVGSGGGSPGWFSSLPGFSSVGSSGGNSATPEATPSISMDNDCPTIDIRGGTGTLAVATKPQGAAGATDLRYQATIMELARQCALSAGIIRVRVGVQGRVVVGPAGAPSQIEVPLRYAVVREGVEPKTIITKLRRVPVSLPSGSLNTVFTDIEEDMSFPMPPYDELQAYIVYVGFDEQAVRPDRQVSAKGKKSR